MKALGTAHHHHPPPIHPNETSSRLRLRVRSRLVAHVDFWLRGGRTRLWPVARLNLPGQLGPLTFALGGALRERQLPWRRPPPGREEAEQEEDSDGGRRG
eukprot:7003465-Prymnesium_polylepis.1